jgi:hypothetical protein
LADATAASSDSPFIAPATARWTAVCAYAITRTAGGVPILASVISSAALTFQSVTTSAHAGATHSAAVTKPDSRTASGVLGIALMTGLLV